MALEVEVWHETIQEKLLQDNSFLTQVAPDYYAEPFEQHFGKKPTK